MSTTKRTTMATVKAFIRKAGPNPHVRRLSRFDGMIDCVQSCDDREFHQVSTTPDLVGPTLGIDGVWFVSGSGDNSIRAFDEKGFKGFHIYNCCGSFDLGVKA